MEAGTVLLTHQCLQQLNLGEIPKKVVNLFPTISATYNLHIVYKLAEAWLAHAMLLPNQISTAKPLLGTVKLSLGMIDLWVCHFRTCFGGFV
jgi:hypothetical protein